MFLVAGALSRRRFKHENLTGDAIDNKSTNTHIKLEFQTVRKNSLLLCSKLRTKKVITWECCKMRARYAKFTTLRRIT